MLPRKLRKRQILSVNQNLSTVYFSLAKFQPVSWNLYLATIWQMTYTHKLPKLCKATLIFNISRFRMVSYSRRVVVGWFYTIPTGTAGNAARMSGTGVLGQHLGPSIGPLVRNLVRSGRKNVLSMRELFCPDPLAGFEKMAGFQIFYCLKIKCFHS